MSSDNNNKIIESELNRKKCFVFFLLLRLINILLSQTWFVPDEYWQAQEVAHNLAFGYFK